jgi:hypothetical protein
MTQKVIIKPSTMSVIFLLGMGMVVKCKEVDLG